MIITLDELTTGVMPFEIGEWINITHLIIRKTTTKNQWVSYPPLSWYEKRELKPPYWRIPETIGNLKNLKSLSLVALDISELPHSITKLQKLETLNLSLNKLQLSNEFDKFRKLKALKDLKVVGNHFDEEEMVEFKREFPKMNIAYKSEIEPG